MPPRKPADEKYVPVTLRLHPRDVERLRTLSERLGLSYGAALAALLELEEQRRSSAA